MMLIEDYQGSTRKENNQGFISTEEDYQLYLDLIAERDKQQKELDQLLVENVLNNEEQHEGSQKMDELDDDE